MDFFDVLRKGCSFGGTRSKEIAFSKKLSAETGVASTDQKTLARRRNAPAASSSLDFFNNDATGNSSSTDCKPGAVPKTSKKRRNGKANNSEIKDQEQDEIEEEDLDEDLDADERTEENGNKGLIVNSQQRKEEVISFRRKHRIHVGAGAPEPMGSFDAMAGRGVPEWLVRNLRGLGFARPTPVQMQCFPAVLAGSHVLASAPTGSGKTIAFLGPVLVLLGRPGKEFARAIIVDPTRELAKQTLDEFGKLTTGRKWMGRLLDRLSGEKAKNIKRLDVAVSTPLRLAQLLRDDLISLDATKHLILDEADKLLDLGFAPQIDEILSYCPKGKSGLLQTLMFSATLPPVVCELANSILTEPLRVSIGDVNAAAPDVQQKLIFIGQEDGKLFSFRQAVQDGRVHPPALIFVQSKERAKQLFGELVYDGIFVDAIHADRTKQQRDNTIKAFRAGKIWMLICTDLMARGVDFKGVETVINYDFPQTAATYIHRIGRTGRAGRAGTALTFFTEQDFEALRSIVGVMRASGCEVPEWMLRLKRRKKKERRMAERRPPERKRISTISGYDLAKAHKKRQMVESTKKRKRPTAEEPGS